MHIHSRTILYRFTSLIISWLSPSYAYIMFILCACIYIILFLCFIIFLCTLARSHLRRWVCMPIFRARHYTLREGPGVHRRFSSSCRIVRDFLSLLIHCMSHSSTPFVCCVCVCVCVCVSSCIVLLHKCADRLMYALFLYWMGLYYVLLLHMIYIKYQHSSSFVMILVQVYRRLNVYM